MMKLKGMITIMMLSSVINTALANENLVTNGDFTAKQLKPWKVFSTGEVVKPTAKITEGVMTITSAQSSEKPINEQLTQQLEGIKSATKYKLTYDAKSVDIKGEMITNLSRSKDWSKGHYGFFKKSVMTNEWKTYTINFTTKQIDADNAPQLKFLVGKLKGDIHFRNVKLIEVKTKEKEKTKEKKKAKEQE